MREYAVGYPGWHHPGRKVGAPSTPWRQAANEAITAAIAEAKALGLEGRALELHVSRAYPFGDRANHPYRVWLHEYHRVLHGRRVPFDHRARKARAARNGPAPGQLNLFP
jgi:hypothetical protein